jgi:predicted nucleic acid-binding Zn ribbon protein
MKLKKKHILEKEKKKKKKSTITMNNIMRGGVQLF